MIIETCSLHSAQGIAGVSVTTHKFTGDERDAETGLDHTWFRQYSSSLGRWMHPDPAGLAAADSGNPQSWNRYAYVFNDPMDYLDPFGLTTCDAKGNNCYDSVTVTADGPGNGGGLGLGRGGGGVGLGSGGPFSEAPSDRPKHNGGFFSRLKGAVSCASETANALSIAGVIGVDQDKHPILAAATNGFVGNTFSGLVDAASHVGSAITANTSSAQDAAGQNLAMDYVLGGATQGLAGRSLHAKGVAGVTTDLVVNALTKAEPVVSLSGTGSQVAAEGLAGPIGWAKIGIDGLVFGGSAIACFLKSH